MQLTVVFFVLLFLSQFGFGDSGAIIPGEEVIALRNVLRSLGFGINIFSDYCSDLSVVPIDSITINCNCNYKNEINTCHVEEIITSSINLKDGSIDRRISGLKYLKKLQLGFNLLSGPIPDTLGQLQNLEELNLYGNLLESAIPPTLGNLKSLKYLRLQRNMLSGGIPAELGNLTNLVTLRLGLNNLTGRIPPQLHQLGMLQFLWLDENQLSGELPKELGKMKNLQFFDVSSNNLTGKLPDSYEKLINLTRFAVDGNNLSGPIPNYIAKWINLNYLYLTGNEFQYLPPDIFKMEKLLELSISDLSNESSFSFPDNDNARLDNINILVLRNCSIHGSIPDYVGNWKSLKYLDLSFNKLGGMIPDSLANLIYLKQVFLTGNMLSGVLPMWISQKKYSKLELSYNNLYPPCSNETDGPLVENIQPTWNNISDMKDQYLASHSKYDSLYINCGGLQIKDEFGNAYDADVSTSNYYKAPNGKWMYTCSGDFWPTISTSPKVYIQNMTCGVPDTSLFRGARLCPNSLSYYAFGLHKGDYNVTLHFQETLYSQYDDYSIQGKRIFDIYIQGTLMLKNFNIKEYKDGPYQELPQVLQTEVQEDGMLHIHLYWAGKGSTNNPPGLNGPLLSAIAVFPSKPKKKLTWNQIAGITAGSVFTPLLLLAFAWKKGWLTNKELDEKVKLKDKEVNPSLRQIMAATKNFTRIDQGNTKGRFGDVYEVKLKDPEVTLAVKKLSPQLKPKNNIDIPSEILKLEVCNHENYIVQLYKGYPKKLPYLLIYEYMEKGNLHDALFGAGRETLVWKTKLDICLGIANGLKYLHDEKNIVHGNITDKNILLDQNHIPKLSECGLATIYDDNPFSNVDKKRRPYLLTTIAPECSYGPPTTQADVYSFGHVMLEIVSGKHCVTDEKEETRTLMDKAGIYEKENNLVYLVDKESIEPGDDESQAKAVEVIKLAMKCLSNPPSSRPEIKEVIDSLENIIREKQSSPSTSSSQLVLA